MAWSGLPHDILQLIFAKLYLVDRIRFRAVYKDWYLASIQFQEVEPVNKQLPWIMNFRFTRRERETTCILFEPFCRQPYNIMNSLEEEPEAKRRCHGFSSCLSIIAANRSGWVLLLTGVDRTISESVMSYQVYNPVTGEVIKLPDLRLQKYPPTHLGAFSSDPTSPDCVFFAVPRDFEGDEVRIFTYSVGDESKSWKTRSFTCPDAAKYSVESVVYMEGDVGRSLFYYFSKTGLLSTFNVGTGEWKPLTKSSCPSPDWFLGFFLIFDDGLPSNRFFLEYGGRPIVVYTMWGAGAEDHPYWCGCEIFSFDLADKVWIKMESLEGGSLFLGNDRHRICFGVPAGDAEGDQTKMIANRVYYFRGDTPSFLTCDGRSEEEEERMGMVDYSDAWGVQPLHHDRIWIHPPLLHSQSAPRIMFN